MLQQLSTRSLIGFCCTYQTLTLAAEQERRRHSCAIDAAPQNVVRHCWNKADQLCRVFFTVQQDLQYDYGMDELFPVEESPTTMQFTYHSNTQMNNILKKVEAQCPDIARTYSIGHSMEGRELLVIEFSNNPGEHELRE